MHLDSAIGSVPIEMLDQPKAENQVCTCGGGRIQEEHIFAAQAHGNRRLPDLVAKQREAVLIFVDNFIFRARKPAKDRLYHAAIGAAKFNYLQAARSASGVAFDGAQ